MKYLKIANPQWATYTGMVGLVKFINGVSEEPVSRNVADRISAAMEMVECDENGDEIAPAGVANRLITDSKNRAPVAEKLVTVSQAELDAEQRDYAAKNAKPPVKTFYTVEQLERIASKSGIKGLREIGDPWGVKGKAIANLIAEIMEAQNNWIRKRDEKLAQTVEREVRVVTAADRDPSLKHDIRIAGETDEEYAERTKPAEEDPKENKDPDPKTDEGEGTDEGTGEGVDEGESTDADEGEDTNTDEKEESDTNTDEKEESDAEGTDESENKQDESAG